MPYVIKHCVQEMAWMLENSLPHSCDHMYSITIGLRSGLFA